MHKEQSHIFSHRIRTTKTSINYKRVSAYWRENKDWEQGINGTKQKIQFHNRGTAWASDDQLLSSTKHERINSYFLVSL